MAPLVAATQRVEAALKEYRARKAEEMRRKAEEDDDEDVLMLLLDD